MFDDRDAPLCIDFWGLREGMKFRFFGCHQCSLQYMSMKWHKGTKREWPQARIQLDVFVSQCIEVCWGETKRLTKDIRERVLLEGGSSM